MNIEEALVELNKRFVYKSDHKLFDNWKILYDRSQEYWIGDCEDYSLTLMWMVSGCNIIKFIWNIITHKHVIWYVNSPSGEGHAVVNINGMYYDNIQKRATSKDQLVAMGYRFKLPFIFPIIFIKIIISLVIGIVR